MFKTVNNKGITCIYIKSIPSIFESNKKRALIGGGTPKALSIMFYVMTKLKENIYIANRNELNNSDTTLDTLETTSDYFQSKNHEHHYHSAIRKYNTVKTFTRIIDTLKDQKEIKKYWQAFHCRNVLLQDGKKIIGSLCRKRWCQNCNRIKTAEMIKKYHKPLTELQAEQNLYFVTLTAPTVEARKLNSEITKRYKAFTRVKDNLRKNYNYKINGLRKLEVTYTKERKFHPHFHLIVQGKKQAELIQSLWLNQFTNANLKAQDIRLINPDESNNLKEVFKYSVKAEVKDNQSARASHLIYKALEGRRTIQTFGKLKAIKEPKESKAEQTVIDWKQPRQEIWVYNQKQKDYFNAYNESLINTKYIDEQANEHKQQREKRHLIHNANDHRPERAIQSKSKRE